MKLSNTNPAYEQAWESFKYQSSPYCSFIRTSVTTELDVHTGCALGGDAEICGWNPGKCPLLHAGAPLEEVELEDKLRQAWVASRARVVEYLELLIKNYEMDISLDDVPEPGISWLIEELGRLANNIENAYIPEARKLTFGLESMEKAIRDFIDSDAYQAAEDVDEHVVAGLWDALYSGYTEDMKWIRTLARALVATPCQKKECNGPYDKPDEHTSERCKVLYELFEANPKLGEELG